MFWIFFLSTIEVGLTLDNGVALTPPMGWMWDAFFCKKECDTDYDAEDCISDMLIRRKADRMKAEGFVDAGYKYILIKSCWMAHNRDKDGNIRPDPDRFPHGIKPLADYLHRLGMKLGLSLSLGVSTCSGRFEGSQGHYEKDAKALASWGVDMVKARGCFVPDDELDESFIMMGFALNSTGRKINYLCNWPSQLIRRAKPVPWNLVKGSCNMWDIKQSNIDSWQELMSLLHYFYHNNATLATIPGKGAWTYPGPMKIDDHFIDGNMSLVHMAVYTMMGFPLFLKGPLSKLTPVKRKILQDPILLAMHRDALATTGFRMKGHFYNGIQIYVRRLTGGRLAVVFVNTQIIEAIYSSYPLKIFLPYFPGAQLETRLIVKDVYAEKEEALKFSSIYEIRRFHPASCLVMTLKIDEHGYQRDLREKMESFLNHEFFSSLSLQIVIIFAIVLYIVQTVVFKFCYDLYVKKREKST